MGTRDLDGDTDPSAWDIGSGASCDARSADSCPQQCWWCIDSLFCAEEWTACSSALPASGGGGGWGSTLLTFAALALFGVAMYRCIRWLSEARDDEDNERPRYNLESERACVNNLGGSWGGIGSVERGAGMDRSVELGACGSEVGGWSAASNAEVRRLPEGQRLLSAWG